MKEQDRFLGCLLGLATGDAIGAAVEFMPRGTFPLVTGMQGGGCWRLKPGQWTDDTSLALCLGTSLVMKGFDQLDQMERYHKWRHDGYMSSTGECFDVGNTTDLAIARFSSSGVPTCGPVDSSTAGNGSIMRLAPIPMYFFPDEKAAIHHAGESSKTTHGATECVEACQILAGSIFRALAGNSKGDILFAHGVSPTSKKLNAIVEGKFAKKSIDEIKGSGYVVQSLEAALWSFHTTGSFEDAILTAVNLGDDTDTTAAVCGQVAGAYYGVDNIPSEWKNQLTDLPFMTSLAVRLHGANGQKQ